MSHQQNLGRGLLKSTVTQSSDNKRIVLSHQAIDATHVFFLQPTNAELQKRFKQKLAELGLKGKVRANQSGCLDQCEHGPNVVIYPEAVWYGGVTLADVDEIVASHIVAGQPVERLMLKDDCLNTATCEHKPNGKR